MCEPSDITGHWMGTFKGTLCHMFDWPDPLKLDFPDHVVWCEEVFEPWMVENMSGKYILADSHIIVYDDQDAMLFKLTWC